MKIIININIYTHKSICIVEKKRKEIKEQHKKTKEKERKKYILYSGMLLLCMYCVYTLECDIADQCICCSLVQYSCIVYIEYCIAWLIHFVCYIYVRIHVFYVCYILYRVYITRITRSWFVFIWWNNYKFLICQMGDLCTVVRCNEQYENHSRHA